jgi:hypothetical protein
VKIFKILSFFEVFFERIVVLRRSRRQPSPTRPSSRYNHQRLPNPLPSPKLPPKRLESGQKQPFQPPLLPKIQPQAAKTSRRPLKTAANV